MSKFVKMLRKDKGIIFEDRVNFELVAKVRMSNEGCELLLTGVPKPECFVNMSIEEWRRICREDTDTMERLGLIVRNECNPGQMIKPVNTQTSAPVNTQTSAPVNTQTSAPVKK